jgi:monoamine oxidase
VVVTIDQCPKTPADGSPPKGVLSGYAMGKKAMELAAMDPAARKALVLNELVERFFGNEAARTPVAYDETDWSAEQWSQGGMIAHFPPGVLTSYGSVLRQPCGRISWAGSERATEMHGLMEGAVRSGEQAAQAVIDKL